MSDVPAFLESLGCRSQPLSVAEYERAIASFPEDVRQALAARDPAGLGRALGARPFMACSILAPDNDGQLPDEQPAAPDEAPAEEEPCAA